MPDYRTPLPQMFAASLEAAVNRVLALDPQAADRLARLEDKVLQLDVQGLGITLFLTARYGTVHINLDSPGEPDTTISGTPFALFAMAAPTEADRWGLPGSRVHISGDANLARDMEQVFRKLDPDWEGQLSTMFGDVLGFQLASGLRQGAEFLRESARKTSEMAGHYFRDESSLLVRPTEFSAFSEQLRTLQSTLDELEQRLRTVGNRAG
jgi:ubiquinone biosynthesis protein UbiJ